MAPRLAAQIRDGAPNTRRFSLPSGRPLLKRGPLGDLRRKIQDRLLRLLALPVFLIVITPMSSTAQNASLQNGEFNSDISHWQTILQPGGLVQWSEADYAGVPTSGSALLVNAIPCIATGPQSFTCSSPSISQCVTVVPGLLYELGFAAFEPPGQSSTGAVNVMAGWNSGSNCDGAALSQPSIGLGHIMGWRTHSTGLLSPSGAQSALIRISAFRDDTFITGDYRIQVDHVTFGSAQVTAVPMMGFGALSVFVLAMAFGGALLVYRGQG